MFSESWWSYSISKIQLIRKIQETQQDLTRTVKRESKRDSRHNRFLYWFTQQPGYVQSLTHSKDFTKIDQPDHVYNTCLQQEYTAHWSTTAEPTADQETTQSPLCVSRTPLLKPTASHSYTESTV